MKRWTRMVFDDWMEGSGSYFSAAAFNPLMGACDVAAVQLVVFNPATATTGTLNAAIEQSGDGIFWSSLIPGSGSIGANGTSSFVVYNNGSLPALPFLRLNLSLVTVTAARVKAYFTGRDKAIRYSFNAACNLLRLSAFEPPVPSRPKTKSCDLFFPSSPYGAYLCDKALTACEVARFKEVGSSLQAHKDCLPYCKCSGRCANAEEDYPGECKEDCKTNYWPT